MRKLHVVILLILGLAMVLGVLAWLDVWDWGKSMASGIKPEVYRTFAEACTTARPEELPEAIRGVAAAAEFVGGTGVHPMLALTTAGDLYASASLLPRGWNPESPRATQLILCIGKERTDLPAPPFPICQHYTDHVPTRQVALYAARSGKKLWTSDFYRYASPCDGTFVDYTTLDAIAAEVKSKIANGSIRP